MQKAEQLPHSRRNGIGFPGVLLPCHVDSPSGRLAVTLQHRRRCLTRYVRSGQLVGRARGGTVVTHFVGSRTFAAARNTPSTAVVRRPSCLPAHISLPPT